VAVASAGPYAYLHFAPDKTTMPASHHSFFTGQMPFLPPLDFVQDYLGEPASENSII